MWVTPQHWYTHVGHTTTLAHTCGSHHNTGTHMWVTPQHWHTHVGHTWYTHVGHTTTLVHTCGSHHNTGTHMWVTENSQQISLHFFNSTSGLRIEQDDVVVEYLNDVVKDSFQLPEEMDHPLRLCARLHLPGEEGLVLANLVQ